MKRTIVFVILLLTILSCGGEKEIKLVMWNYEREKVDFLKGVIKSYENKHPNIKITMKYTFSSTDTEDLKKNYLASLKEGNAPDIINGVNDWIGQYVVKNAILPLDSYLTKRDKNSYLKIAMDSVKYGGKIYALPSAVECIALIYNRSIIKQVPKTLAEMEKIAKSFIANRNNMYGIAFQYTVPYFYIPWFMGFGGTMFENDSYPNFNSQAAYNSIKYIKGLIDKRIMPAFVNDQVMLTLFSKGRCPFIITGPWNIPAISKMQIDFAIDPLPVVEQTGKRIAPFVGVKIYMVSSASKHPKEAFNFIKYLTGAEISYRATKRLKTIPANKGAMRKDILKDKIIRGFFEQSKYGIPMPSDPRMAFVWEINTALEDIFINNANIKERLKKAQIELENKFKSIK